MQHLPLTAAVVLTVCLASCLTGQSAAARDSQLEAKSLAPRATPGDYISHAQVGTITIAAEFTGHALPTFEGPLTSEEYVAVEVALFGPAGAHLQIAASDFSLRINGKKNALETQPYGLTLASLRDPEWIPPESPAAKSKTSFGASSQKSDSKEPAEPVKIPVPVQRAMAQRLQRSVLPEGDRALPQAGLIFFQHRGKTENIQSLELIYEGPAGKGTLKLQP